MESEVLPFPGSTFAIHHLLGVPVMNFSSTSLSTDEYRVASLRATVFEEEIVGSIGTKETIAAVLKALPEVRAIFIFSPSPILPLLMKIVEGKKKGKSKGRDGPAERVITHTPRLRSRVKQQGTGYAIDCTFELSLLNSPLAVVSAVAFGAKGSSSDSTFFFRLSIKTDSEKALLRYIEEGIASGGGGGDDINPTALLTKLYLDPAMVYLLYIRGEEFPSFASIEKNRDAIVKNVATYGSQFQTLLRACVINLFIPPMPSEEAYRLLTKIEVTLIPDLVDREFIIERKKTAADPLFDRLYRMLGEEGYDMKKRREVLSFNYGSLLDLGQVFTYGECAEIVARARLVVE